MFLNTSLILFLFALITYIVIVILMRVMIRIKIKIKIRIRIRIKIRIDLFFEFLVTFLSLEVFFTVEDWLAEEAGGLGVRVERELFMGMADI